MNRRRFAFLFLSMGSVMITLPTVSALANEGRGNGSGSGRSGGRDGGDRGGGRSDSGKDSRGGGGNRSEGARSGGSRNPGRETQIGPDGALGARNRGEIISLKDALDVARQKNPGKVIEVKLFSNGDTATYRIKTMDKNGAVKSTRLDAHTGEERGLLDVLKRSLGLDEDTSGGR